MFKSKIRKQIENQINELQLYLENNYKDLAIEARKGVSILIEESYERKQINNKVYLSYKKRINEYTEQMKDYNHQQFYKS